MTSPGCPYTGKVEQYRGPITLNGLSGTTKSRLAIINNRTFSDGESSTIKVDGETVSVRCAEIRKESAVIEVEGMEVAQEIWLRDAR